jgi:hypothetical protein
VGSCLHTRLLWQTTVAREHCSARRSSIAMVINSEAGLFGNNSGPSPWFLAREWQLDEMMFEYKR